jgi:hypothetical protein
MGWSKLDLVNKAFAQIGLASYVFDLQPEQLQDALSTMDAMMGEWNAKGIRLGYAMSSTPIVVGTVDSGLPDSAFLAVFTNLAVILASGVGRQVSPELNKTAKRSFDTLLALASVSKPVRLPGNMPAGAGHKGWRGWDRTFIGRYHENDLEAGPDVDLSFEGKKPDQ